MVQEAALERQEELAGFLFHELRNDNNATVGVLDSIVEDLEGERATLAPELRSMVLNARVHAHHAVQVISNMLDYTKLRAGKLKLPTTVPFQVRLPYVSHTQRVANPSPGRWRLA